MNFVMKKISHLILMVILALSLNSCSKWLDVNVDPSNPTNVVASCAARLPWIQHAYGYAYGSAASTAATITGHLATISTNAAYETWSPGTGAGPTTPYQQWFVDGASNVQDLITKAKAEQAWHYIGAAHTVNAMGYILQADVYGEMPYKDAVGNSLAPKYDDGKTIYEGCLEELDSAIIFFQKTQPATATPLAAGDNWNGGDVQKWIKLCYGLKARCYNNMSKKSAMYKPADILEAISKGPQSNGDGTVINHFDSANDMVGDPLIGDPLKTSFIFDIAAWGSWARISKWYLDLLENTYTGGSGVEDPRTSKLVPSAQHHMLVPDKANPGQYKDSVYFIRTKGVDLIKSDIKLTGGPLAPNYNTTTKKWYVTTTNPARLGDTAYLQIRSLCAMIAGAGYNEVSTRTWTDGTVMTTGTFYSRPDSPTDVLTYHEMCFIKAEVMFRQGNKTGALAAYKEGVKAHMELMNAKLKTWAGDKLNPDRNPMKDSDITAFLASKAIAQTESELTMAKIMQQKFIAMSFTVQNWNDMRRFNYSTPGTYGVVYPDFDRPMAFSSTSTQYFPGAAKTDENYWFRRFKQCSHEINYNQESLKASNSKALLPEIWSVPVWWDKAE